MRSGRLFPVLSLSLLVVSCAPGEPKSLTLVSDSAGIRIVEYRGVPPVDTLNGSLVLQFGTVDGVGPEQFDRIVGMALLSDGSLVVADQGSGEIRVFPRDGRPPRVMGGKGDGPGEFRTLAGAFVLRDDSILGFDGRGARFAVFTKDGSLGRTGSLRAPEVGGIPRLEGLLAGDSWLCSVRLPTASNDQDSESGRSFHDAMLLFRYSQDGLPLASLGQSSSLEKVRQRQGSALTTQLLPLGSQGYWGVAGGRVFSLSSTHSEVRFVSDLREVWVRWTPLKRELTAEEWEGALEEEIADADPARAPMLRERYARMPRPRWMPLYDRAVGGEAGSVWLREVGSSRWVIVDPEAALRRLVLPQNFTPQFISGGSVFGVWKDDLNVEHVRAYGPGS